VNEDRVAAAERDLERDLTTILNTKDRQARIIVLALKELIRAMIEEQTGAA
jgi:hypothetical protein